MKRENRWVWTAVLVFFLLPLGAAAWAAETYPEREIRIIIATSTGGGVDRMARAVQRFLPDILKVSVLAENRAGAGGKIAIRYYLKEPADGHTLFTFHQPGLTDLIAKNPGLFKLEDLAYININWTDPTLLVAHKDTGWKTLEDMIEDVKKNPGKYSFAAPSPSSAGTVMSKMLFEKLGLNIRIAPYGGGGEARTALLGHHVDMTAGGAEGLLAVEQVAVPLAVFGKKVPEFFPTTQPINEALAKYNVKMPNAAAYRFFAVHREFKEKYPERWKILVDAFHKLITEHKEFQEFCDKGKIGRDWVGPEESFAMIKEVHEIFFDILSQK